MRLVARPTRGNGDCAFHAVCGRWNGQEYVYQDILTLRKEVADQIRAIAVASHNLFSTVSEAIKELIRGNNQQIQLDASEYPLITTRQRQYQPGQEDFEDLETFDPELNHPIIKEYAKFIQTPGMWLLPCELSVIAHARNITIHHFIRDQQVINGYRLVEKYNPGTQHVANVFFNGVNHYEAMETDKGPFNLPPSQRPLTLSLQSSIL